MFRLFPWKKFLTIIFLELGNTDCEEAWTQLLWSVLGSLPLTHHNRLWLYWMHIICKGPSGNNFCNGKDIFMVLYVSPFQIFLSSTSPSELVWSLLTLLHSLQILPCVRVQWLVFMSPVRCSKEAWLDTLACLAVHLKAFSATVRDKGEWVIAQHDTMFFLFVKWETLNSLQTDYLSMEILLTSKMMKLFELWWRCGKKGKYDFVFMLFQLYIIFYFFLLHWNTWLIYLPMIQLVWILFITCLQH